ncbi:TIGR02265 family protein [Archangium violaceum]|uniref:TIGR02265 family protein n=1 Tax=Archangium violaceum TaxID=83451 RepID=UPI0036DC84CE
MSDETGEGRGPSYDAREDLESRLRLATPEYTTRGILFLATLASVRELGGEAMVKRCVEASGESEFVEFFNYPTSALLRMLGTAAGLLGASLGGYAEVLRYIAKRTVETYMTSVVGRSAQLVSSTDPMRLVRTLEALYKVSMVYSEPTVVWKGPKRGVLTVQRTFTPLAYHEGGALTLGAMLGLKNVEAYARPTGPLSLELEISWE